MKQKIALGAILLLGLQTAVFAAPRKMVAPRWPRVRPVVNVVDGRGVTHALLASLVENVSRQGVPAGRNTRRIKAGLEIRPLETPITSTVRVAPRSSVVLVDLARADTRGGMDTLTYRVLQPGDQPRSPDYRLEATVAVPSGLKTVSARGTKAARCLSPIRDGQVLSVALSDSLKRKVGLGSHWPALFVDVLRTITVKLTARALPRI